MMTKQDYINQIKAAAKKLINKADYILEDYNDHIYEIEITMKIAPQSFPEIKINKRYGVNYLEEDNNNE